ncbi:hypothetical protein [Kitasatospora cineracea]
MTSTIPAIAPRAADPLPRREPGETFRKPPATVGKPKPIPQPQTSAA